MIEDTICLSGMADMDVWWHVRASRTTAVDRYESHLNLQQNSGELLTKPTRVYRILFVDYEPYQAA
jgi:hypothetical protein